MKTYNNSEIPLLARFGLFLGGIAYANKSDGFKGVVKYIYNACRIKGFTWSYRHVKFVRKRVDKNLEKQNPILRAFTCLVLFNEPFNYKEIYKNIPDDKKEEVKEQISKNLESALQKTIAENNITNEEEIKKLREEFDVNKLL